MKCKPSPIVEYAKSSGKAPRDPFTLGLLPETTLLMTGRGRKQAFSYGENRKPICDQVSMPSTAAGQDGKSLQRRLDRPLHSRASAGVGGRDNTSHDMTRLLS